MKDFTGRLIQDGIVVVKVSSPTIEQTEKEINRYAFLYSQDGRVEIKRNYFVEKIKEDLK